MNLLEVGKKLLLISLTCIVLVSCSGGIDGTGTTTPDPDTENVEGTAATGAPIANSVITIKGSAGNKVRLY